MRKQPINLFEFEEAARLRLNRMDYDGVAGGAMDEITVRRNRAAFDSIMLRPRVLVDTSRRDLATTALGQPLSFPVMLAPAGYHGRAHPDGELATARAAGAAGIVMVVSRSSTVSLEEIAKAATGPLWFGQYIYKDRGVTLEMASRARAAGCAALSVSFNAYKARRERDIHNGYDVPAGPAGKQQEAKSGVQPTDADLTATWSDLDWLASKTGMPVVAKGIMTGEDAKLCAEHGASAVIVSNVGGRQLDTTFATIEVLPEVVDAVHGRIEVYLDGGIRRGADILKAIALGARAVLIGRPIFWGLAVDGEAGARAVLQILRDELELAMAMCGRPTIKSIDASLVGMQSPLVPALASWPRLNLAER